MEGKKVYICLAISILAIVIPLFFRDYTMFEIICYSFFSLFLVIGATIDKLYYILPDEGALALTIIGIVYSISEQYAVLCTSESFCLLIFWTSWRNASLSSFLTMFSTVLLSSFFTRSSTALHIVPTPFGSSLKYFVRCFNAWKCICSGSLVLKSAINFPSAVEASS